MQWDFAVLDCKIAIKGVYTPNASAQSWEDFVLMFKVGSTTIHKILKI